MYIFGVTNNDNPPHRRHPMTAFYVKGTDNKVRTSKTRSYRFAVVSHYGCTKPTCHETMEAAIKRIAAEKADYNPNKKDHFVVVELEAREK